MKLIRHFALWLGTLFRVIPAIGALTVCLFQIPSSALAATFTVNSTADQNDASPGNGACATSGGVCTLRAAISEANALGGSHIIDLPAGTYQLTLANAGGLNEDDNATGDLDIRASVTIQGAGSAVTLIQAGTNTTNGIDKVFGVNPLCEDGVSVAINGVTIRYGRNTQAFDLGGDYGFTGGGIDWCGGTGVESFTLTNSVVSDNTNVNGYGGGLNTDSFWGNTGAVTLTNVTFQNNRTLHLTNDSNGGGMNVLGYQPNVTITNCQFIGNSTTGPVTAGGGIQIRPGYGGTVNISKSVFLANFSGTRGGAISLAGSSNQPSVTIQYSRITGNMSAAGSGIDQSSQAAAVATNNWWGCSTGPGGAPCDGVYQAAGAAAISTSPFLQVRTTATTNPIVINQTTGLTASFRTNSAGTDVSANIDRLIGLGVAWSGVGGIISGAQSSIQADGTATANYQAVALGVGQAAAVVDADTTVAPRLNVVSITANPAGTTTAIISDLPDPSAVGAPVAVSYAVTGAFGNSPLAPTGNVTVSDGVNSCTGTVAAGGCDITLTTQGNRTLTAAYAGDAIFNASSSAGEPHSVDAPPSISKVFGTATIPLNGTTSLTFSIANNSAGALTGVGFVDNLPAGLVVATPNGMANSCGGTVTAVAGSGTITLTDGVLAVPGICTVTVDVTGTTPAVKDNTTSNVTSNEKGPGNTASASLTVVAPPSISKAFGTGILAYGQNTTLDLTISNSNALDLTGVAFTDMLPAGLVVAAPSGLSHNCGPGATVTADPGATSVSLAGGTVAAGSTCTVHLEVTSTALGVLSNTAVVTSTNGGMGNAGTAILTVVPAVSINGGIAPSEAGSTVGTFTVTLTAAPLGPLTVNYNLGGSTAGNPADYSLTAGTNITALDGSSFTIAAGQTTATINIVPVDDLIDEDVESVQLSLVAGTDYLLGTTSATRDLADNDTAGVTISKATAGVTEGGASDTYTVRLDTIPAAPVTVSFTTGTQIQAIGALAFSADASAMNPQVVTVQAVDDPAIEGNHSQLIGHTAGGGDAKYSATTIAGVTTEIIDNDCNYDISTAGAAVVEGNPPGTTGITFTITRSGDTTGASSVDFSVGGSATGGTDFNNLVPAPGTINFGAGVTTQTVTLDVVGDFLDENDETIVVTLANPTGTNGTGTGTTSNSPITETIQDDDTASITVSPASVTVSEPNTTASFTISLTSLPTAAVTINLVSSDVTECTVPASVTLDATNWQTGVAVAVTAADDSVQDGDQAATIQTAAASGDPQYDGSAVADVAVTVTDDDTAGIIISAISGPVGEDGTTATYTVRLRSIPTAIVTVSPAPGAQLQGIGALTFAADATALSPQTVTLSAVNDAVVEGDHTATIGHSSASGDPDYDGDAVSFTPASDPTVNIVDNDNLYTLSAAAPLSVTEDDAGTSNFSFTVTRTGHTSGASSVDFTLGGTAATPEDYTTAPAPGTLGFAAGETSKTITVTVMADGIDEDNETVQVTLLNPTGTDPTGTGELAGSPSGGTIQDDDTAGITVTPVSLTIANASGIGTFNIRLNSQPEADVVIALTSSDPGEVTVPASVTLTSTNWATGVDVTVTAVRDGVTDGPQTCAIVTGAATSADPQYDGLDPADVNVTADDDAILLAIPLPGWPLALAVLLAGIYTLVTRRRERLE